MAYKQLKLWFDEDLALMLSEKIKATYPAFSTASFVKTVKLQVPPLELKARVACIADALKEHMTGAYEKDISVFSKILGPENEKETGMFLEYYWLMPIAAYVEKYGLNHFKLSMQIIEEITKRNTGEYSIRPFLRTYPERTIAQMKKWSKSKNKHVRRLASEGGRPRLPWATKLQPYIDDPQALLPILEQLKNDQSKYVQKSVANCINDILKDNPSTAKALIESWAKNSEPACQWIIKHAIRNLRKAKDPWATKIMVAIS